MSVFWQDIRYGLRILAKNPGFAVIAILTLALGIGANTALFSVVHGVLLKPMPYENPEQLVDVYWTTPESIKSSHSHSQISSMSEAKSIFSLMAAYRWENFSLLGVGEPERLAAERVSAEFFRSPQHKASSSAARFLREEDKLGAAPVVLLEMISGEAQFNSSPTILGAGLNLSGESLYHRWRRASALAISRSDSRIDVFVPINLYNDPVFRDRKVHNGTYASARLKPGVTLAQARADMDVIAHDLVAAYPEIDKGSGINLVPIKEDTVGDVRKTLLLLMGAVGCRLANRLRKCCKPASRALHSSRLVNSQSAARSAPQRIRLVLSASY